MGSVKGKEALPEGARRLTGAWMRAILKLKLARLG